MQALKLLKEYLPASYKEGAKNPVARERVHNAATIAGIAFANAFLGVCHSMAHKLGSEFHIPHGTANAMLISNVIRYNANDNPTKQTAFSQYDRPQARRRYAEIADHLGLSAPGDRTAQKIEKLLARLDELKTELGIPTSIREAGVQEADFGESRQAVGRRIRRPMYRRQPTLSADCRAEANHAGYLLRPRIQRSGRRGSGRSGCRQNRGKEAQK